VPLFFAPGEAYQFDWSHEIVVINGVTTTVKVAHVRLMVLMGAAMIAGHLSAFSFRLLENFPVLARIW